MNVYNTTRYIAFHMPALIFDRTTRNCHTCWLCSRRLMNRIFNQDRRKNQLSKTWLVDMVRQKQTELKSYFYNQFINLQNMANIQRVNSNFLQISMPLMRSDMDHTVLPANNAISAFTPSRRASPPFGRYSLRLPTERWPGWVDLGGWLDWDKFPARGVEPRYGHPSQY